MFTETRVSRLLANACYPYEIGGIHSGPDAACVSPARSGGVDKRLAFMFAAFPIGRLLTPDTTRLPRYGRQALRTDRRLARDAGSKAAIVNPPQSSSYG